MTVMSAPTISFRLEGPFLYGLKVDLSTGAERGSALMCKNPILQHFFRRDTTVPSRVPALRSRAGSW